MCPSYPISYWSTWRPLAPTSWVATPPSTTVLSSNRLVCLSVCLSSCLSVCLLVCWWPNPPTLPQVEDAVIVDLDSGTVTCRLHERELPRLPLHAVEIFKSRWAGSMYLGGLCTLEMRALREVARDSALGAGAAVVLVVVYSCGWPLKNLNLLIILPTCFY